MEETDEYGKWTVEKGKAGALIRVLYEPSVNYKDIVGPPIPPPGKGRSAIKELDDLKAKLKELGIQV